jgi:hypothetical protein
MTVTKRRTATHLALFATLASCLFLTACRKPMDLGQWTGGQYYNEYFGLTISAPDGWVPVTRATMRKLGKEAAKFIGKKDKELARMLDSGAIDSYQLFMFAQHELGTPVEFNHNLVCSIDRLTSKVKTPPQVMQEIKKTLRRLGIRTNGPEETVTIGSNTFQKLGGTFSVHGTDVSQEYYILLKNGYALTFVLSFGEGDPAYDTLVESLETLTFLR